MSNRFRSAEKGLDQVEKHLLGKGYSEIKEIVDDKNPSWDAIMVDTEKKEYWYVQKKYFEKQIKVVLDICGELVGEFKAEEVE